MIEIKSNSGDYFVFDPDTELISKNGVIVPYSEYQPAYVRNGVDENDNLPTFAGVMDVSNNTIITLNGFTHKLINNDNEITL